MEAQVVWFEGQRVRHMARFFEVVAAVVFHYERVVFGARFGMKGVGA